MRRVATLVLAFAAIGLVVVSAATGAEHFKTKVKIDNIGPHKMKRGSFEVSGHLESPNKDCVGDRKVKAYFKRSGDDKKLGRGTTLGSGAYSIGPPLSDFKAGKYYVVSVKHKFGSTVCDADTSRDYVVKT